MELKEDIETTMKTYPQHTFVSFISSVRLNKEQWLDPSLSTLIVAGKSPKVIGKFASFIIEDYVDQEQETGLKFSIDIHLKV